MNACAPALSRSNANGAAGCIACSIGSTPPPPPGYIRAILKNLSVRSRSACSPDFRCRRRKTPNHCADIGFFRSASTPIARNYTKAWTREQHGCFVPVSSKKSADSSRAERPAPKSHSSRWAINKRWRWCAACSRSIKRSHPRSSRHASMPNASGPGSVATRTLYGCPASVTHRS